MMNEKETGELRRRLKTDRCAVSSICGCFVDETGEIKSTFKLNPALMYKDDFDALLGVMKKALSGKPGKNLIDLPFTTEQVMDSPEHRMLMDIRNGGENCEEALNALFMLTAQNLQMGISYVILVAKDKYDVPSRDLNGEKTYESENVFDYFLCAVCPVKETKPALGFFANENTFRSISADRVLGAPELGFLFPAFDDRTANIYDVLYYTKNSAMNHPEFIEKVLRVDVPMPADFQKDAFNALLSDTLTDDCSMDVALAVHDRICAQIEEYKTEGGENMPVVSKKTVAGILENCGVAPEKVESFSTMYDESFGAAAEFMPHSIIDTGSISVETPEVSIKINSDRSDIVDTRIIDGVKYILIRAENNVEVNGVTVKIK